MPVPLRTENGIKLKKVTTDGDGRVSLVIQVDWRPDECDVKSRISDFFQKPRQMTVREWIDNPSKRSPDVDDVPPARFGDFADLRYQ